MQCHFPDKMAAAREMRRVLAPDGKVAVATWRSLTEIPFFLKLHRVAERHVGTVLDQRYGFGDATALEELLADAAFHDVRLETMWRTIRFTDPAVFVRMNAMAIVGMSAASATMDDAKRAQVVAVIANESAEVLPTYTDREGLTFEISTNVATAGGRAALR